MTAARCNLSTESLEVDYGLVAWDSAALGRPAAQIFEIHLRGPDAAADFRPFRDWCVSNDIALVSCRLSHLQLRESMFLEDQGFRFIEMVHHPVLAVLDGFGVGDEALRIESAAPADYPVIRDIAERAFSYERFAQDPRLDPALAGRRYGNWVDNTRGSDSQQLIKFVVEQTIVGFFIIEVRADGTCYWHLTAIAPEYHGQGYGKRAWRKAVAYAQGLGATRIRTTIAARNTPVLNLYVRLGFQFEAPSMSFHWLA